MLGFVTASADRRPEPEVDPLRARESHTVPDSNTASDPQTAPDPRTDLPPPAGNVVPLRSASERAVHRQYVTSGAERTAAVDAQPSRKPTPIFGSAAVHLPQWPISLVLCGMAIGLIVVATNSVHTGCIVLGASVAVAFLLRLVLTDRDAGMLRVRGRVADLIVFGSFASGLLLFAFWVPAPN